MDETVNQATLLAEREYLVTTFGNADKFSNPDDVHNPMMLLLDVQDQNYSKHLERFLGRTKLVAFVCGNTGDAKVLMNARKSNHFRDVNVIDSSGFQFVRSFNRFVG